MFSYLGACILELRIDFICSWSGLGILDFITIFASHSESWWIFIDTVLIEIVVTWTGCQSLPKRTGFSFITHSNFGSRFTIAQIVVPRSRRIVAFHSASIGVSNSKLTYWITCILDCVWTDWGWSCSCRVQVGWELFFYWLSEGGGTVGAGAHGPGWRIPEAAHRIYLNIKTYWVL